MIECVPNISEGRDLKIVRVIEDALTVPLLDSTSDADHNRSVLTFAGSPAEITANAFAVIEAASRLIDISAHQGVHPRTGAADVVPFVPVRNATLEHCAALAHETGARVWEELRIPVYFYEAAAKRAECTRLENVRRHMAALVPDIGDAPHPTAGVCIVGARKFLVAWNINLKSTDIALAREIAATIRESNGGLRAVKALGLPLAGRKQVQISMNLVDYEVTPLHAVFRRVCELCGTRGVEIEGSELIGLIPQDALAESAGHDLRWLNLTPARILENALRNLQ